MVIQCVTLAIDALYVVSCYIITCCSEIKILFHSNQSPHGSLLTFFRRVFAHVAHSYDHWKAWCGNSFLVWYNEWERVPFNQSNSDSVASSCVLYRVSERSIKKISSLDQFHEKWCTMCLYMCIDVGKLFIDKVMWYRILVNSVSHTHTHTQARRHMQTDRGRKSEDRMAKTAKHREKERERERERQRQRQRDREREQIKTFNVSMILWYEWQALMGFTNCSRVLLNIVTSFFKIVFQLLLLLILYNILCSCVSPNIILLSS